MSSTGAAGPETRGALVNILSWFLMVTSFMAILARLATKYVVVRKFGIDDGCVVLSLVSSFPGLVCVFGYSNTAG
jgi:hypothetical protein